MSNRRKTRATCPCTDCGWPTVWRGQPGEWYVVHDRVWEAAGMDPDHLPEWGSDGEHYYLCVGCLEARLGRELTAADFTGAEVNDPAVMWMTARLAARVTDYAHTGWGGGCCA